MALKYITVGLIDTQDQQNVTVDPRLHCPWYMPVGCVLLQSLNLSWISVKNVTSSEDAYRRLANGSIDIFLNWNHFTEEGMKTISFGAPLYFSIDYRGFILWNATDIFSEEADSKFLTRPIFWYHLIWIAS